MARIGKPLEASDHELAPGVFFRLKPADSLILLSAEAKARAEISEILSGGARMAEWGFEVNGEPVATDDEWLSLLAGLSVFISACFLAELMLEGWSGIEAAKAEIMEGVARYAAAKDKPAF